jgi:hypothetical protein
MKNATYAMPPSFQTKPPIGEVAGSELQTSVPGSSASENLKVRQTPQPRQKGIQLPMIPFYVRSDAPDLQEFLIY